MKMRTGERWSAFDDSFLIANYADQSWDVLLSTLLRSRSGIKERARTLGLRRPRLGGQHPKIVEMSAEERGMRVALRFPNRIPNVNDLIEFIPMGRATAYRSIRLLKDVRGIE